MVRPFEVAQHGGTAPAKPLPLASAEAYLCLAQGDAALDATQLNENFYHRRAPNHAELMRDASLNRDLVDYVDHRTKYGTSWCGVCGQCGMHQVLTRGSSCVV